MAVKMVSNDVFFAEVESRLLSDGEIVVPLRGTSMLPLLDEKRHNLVLSADFGELTEGDIVLFRHNGNHLLHRIRRIDGERITTQGDAVPHTESCTRDDVIAVLVKITDRRTGEETDCRSAEWRRLSRRTLFWKNLKRKIKKTIGK